MSRPEACHSAWHFQQHPVGERCPNCGGEQWRSSEREWLACIGDGPRKRGWSLLPGIPTGEVTLPAAAKETPKITREGTTLPQSDQKAPHKAVKKLARTVRRTSVEKKPAEAPYEVVEVSKAKPKEVKSKVDKTPSPRAKRRIRVLLRGGTVVDGYTSTVWLASELMLTLVEAQVRLMGHQAPYSKMVLKSGPTDVTRIPRDAVLSFTTFDHLKDFEED